MNVGSQECEGQSELISVKPYIEGGIKYLKIEISFRSNESE